MWAIFDTQIFGFLGSRTPPPLLRIWGLGGGLWRPVPDGARPQRLARGRGTVVVVYDGTALGTWGLVVCVVRLRSARRALKLRVGGPGKR